MSVTSDFPLPSEAVPEILPAKISPRQEASNDMRECVERTLHIDARAPVSTYRVQMHKDFTFANAQGIVGYLKKLGISDFYSSPIFEARSGSMHGYDVTRHDRLNPELGGDDGFVSFSAELQRQGLGLLLDIVPNHMGVGNDSVWWQDVLENGHASQYSEYFDIDWKPLKPALRNKLLLPILGNQYGTELENKRIQLSIENGRPRVHYYDHIMPVAPRTVHLIFDQFDGSPNPLPQFLRELLEQIDELPPHETANDELREQRRQRLAYLLPLLQDALRSPEMQPLIQQALQTINGVEGDPHSFDRLHLLLDAQPYRLASWRTSAEEINYRRFFDVNDLVGLRMENPQVFAATHCLIRELLATRRVTGLRIDHCDGMFNPRQYLIRLQLLYLASQCAGEVPRQETAANGIERSILDPARGYDWSQSQGPLYTVVEKILEPREYLPREWPVRGTSGYDFVYLANGIFIQGANEKRFNVLYAQVLGHTVDPDEIIYRSKLQVMQTALASEVYTLTNLLSRIAAANRKARDFTDNILETVIRQTIAAFPVYRTYIDDRGQYGERDVAFLRFAVARAKRLNPDIDSSAFDFLRETLLLLQSNSPSARQKPDPQMLYFALKFQQLTGPVMAKGVEDTTFYVYTRFLSSNEVGGSAKSFGISLDTLHQSNQERVKHSPDTMLTTSTHDTKRSEDVRNRLNVLSEMPQLWSSSVHRWQRMNAKFKQKMEDGRIAPDNNEEYLLYQTILGAWPWQMQTQQDRENYVQRIREYASKALSEAKVNLSWINPDPEYTKAVHEFITAILMPGTRGKESPFVASLNSLLPQLQLFGAVNSLAQVVLKIAVPGIPDFYQGNELWELNLVDPDNRRPVDYNQRSVYLDALHELSEREGPAAVCRNVLSNLADGRAKLWTTHRALQLRAREHSIFRHGEYTALEVAGDHQEMVIAFLRRDANSERSVLAALPRFPYTLMRGKPELPLGPAWGNDQLRVPVSPGTRYTNVFTGESLNVPDQQNLPLSAILATYPVALLVSQE
jgi:(1->4)-alpha-D-glucan 1-alpha-D-glucosylmutase